MVGVPTPFETLVVVKGKGDIFGGKVFAVMPNDTIA